jgi:Protein of unknown function (DUF3999)
MRLALHLGVLNLVLANAAMALTPPALTPQDFAYGMPVMAMELAAAYRVPLPVDVYKVSVHDLGDVRVFNSQGEAEPYAIRRVDVPAESGPKQVLPLFPLHGDAQGSQGLKLTLDSPNGAIRVQTNSAATDSGPAPQYLIDARPLDAGIAALELSWPDSSADFSGRIRVESSDDLSTWRPVLAAPVANLHAGDQQLVERRIVTPDIKAKFLRLSWIGSKPSFELSEVQAQVSAGEPRINWSTVVVTGQAVKGESRDYDFDLGARLPLERVNLVLPDANSVYMADFKSRPDEKAPWRSVTHAGVYRVTTSDGEQSNGPIEVPIDHDRYWRVHLSGESGATVALRLQGSWSPSEIEFLAHGQPPFTLAYGSSSIDGAATDLSIIPSGTLLSTATLGPRMALGGEARISVVNAFLEKRSLLWVVLVVAVAALAIMARRLARDRLRR